jgi:hypothetical protein
MSEHQGKPHGQPAAGRAARIRLEGGQLTEADTMINMTSNVGSHRAVHPTGKIGRALLRGEPADWLVITVDARDGELVVTYAADQSRSAA